MSPFYDVFEKLKGTDQSVTLTIMGGSFVRGKVIENGAELVTLKTLHGTAWVKVRAVAVVNASG